MTAFFNIDGNIAFRPGTDLDQLLVEARAEINWMKDSSEMIRTIDYGIIDYHFEGHGEASRNWSSDLIAEFTELKDYIVAAEIYIDCDDEHLKFEWDSASQEFYGIFGQVCYSADDVERYFPRPVPYDQLLSMFRDYVENDAAAAELDYVQMALEAVGCDHDTAEKIGLGWA